MHGRYLILTYAAEYDRVHYPLPLAYVESPGREQLERTIGRLGEVSERGKASLAIAKSERKKLPHRT